jgi:hypothetical protein
MSKIETFTQDTISDALRRPELAPISKPDAPRIARDEVAV